VLPTGRAGTDAECENLRMTRMSPPVPENFVEGLE